MASTVRTLEQQGILAAQATHQAQGVIVRSMYRQAAMLSYLDAFQLLAISAVCMIPFVFLLKKNKPGKGGGAAH